MNDLSIKTEHVSKRYRLGVVGSGMLYRDLQSWWARKRGLPNPNLRIGEEEQLRGEEFWALDDINLKIEKGEALGIIGKNGAGKSTLLKLITQVTAPTEGKILINGRVSSMLEVGTGFHPEMTGRENVYLSGAILGMRKQEIDRKLDEIIAFSECDQFIDTPVKRYSSGMYVKLAFSVAAHLDSDIVIMDEVLAVGDMAFQSKCINRMKNISMYDDRTVLYVSHNMNTIRRLCNRCIVLDKGKLVFDGSPDDAIAVYLGGEQASTRNVSIVVDNDENMLRKSIAWIENVRFTDKDENQFSWNEQLGLSIQWASHEKIDHPMQIRTVIRYVDSSLAGTAVSNVFYAAGVSLRHTTKLMIDISTLAPGKYYVTFDLLYNEQHEVQDYKNIYTLTQELYFEKRPEYEYDVWKHNYWGNTQFPCLGTESVDNEYNS